MYACSGVSLVSLQLIQLSILWLPFMDSRTLILCKWGANTYLATLSICALKAKRSLGTIVI